MEGTDLARDRLADGRGLAAVATPEVADRVVAALPEHRAVRIRASGIEDPAVHVGVADVVRPLQGHLDELSDFHRHVLGVVTGTASPMPVTPVAVGTALLFLLSRAAADGPLLIRVDGVDHLDASSSRALAFVAQRLEDDPVVLLATADTLPEGAWAEVSRLGPLAPASSATAAETLDDRELEARAHDAAARGGLADAAALLDRAAGRCDDDTRAADLSLQASRLWTVVGDQAQVVRSVDRVVQRGGTLAQQGDAIRIRGNAEILSDAPTVGVDRLRTAGQGLAATDSVRAATLHVEACLGACFDGRVGQAADWAREALALAPDDPFVTVSAANVLLLAGQSDPDLLDRAAARIEELQLPDPAAVVGRFRHAHSLLLAERLDESRALVDPMVGLARLMGAVGALPFALLLQAQLQLEDGQLLGARGLAAESASHGRAADQQLVRGRALILQGRLEGLMGNTSVARDLLVEALAVAPGRAALHFYAASARGITALSAGDPELAVSELRAARDLFDQGGSTSPAIDAWWADLVEAEIEAGIAPSVDVLDTMTDAARRLGHASSLRLAARARALLEPARADALLAELDHEGNRFERARTALVRSRLPSDLLDDAAREALRVGARESFAAVGSRAWASRADADDDVPAAVADLTPQEYVVASAVAEGRTNRDVAADLFLSPKTVENHLTRIYAKLGVRNRSQLTRLLVQA